ncbi:BLOC-2 complex member HPS5 homolog [Cydia amplana]|uniref:BLOC-2 complex member HPS5 homolog n=1 Tax=Cydia amplana TaxID=1869771 RepID=UPI002FE4FFBC
MSSNKLPPYVLLELPPVTDQINFPLKSAQRIKYTCFDVSKSLIAFGATSGGIYIFNRTPCEFVQLIPNKDGAITRVAISKDEKHIACANGRGIVTVTDCDQACAHTVTSKEHAGNEVTAMAWSGNMLFAGDDVGRISVLHLHSFIAKTMFQSSSQTIMSLDSRICQLDMRDCMLLVSTLTRCYVCNTTQEQYRQIGQKLRDGEFGACFVTKDNVENSIENAKDVKEVKKYNIVDDDAGFSVGEKLANTLIYCARPSSRLWEATVDGTVRRTHQFKHCLAKNYEVVTLESYNNENLCLDKDTSETEGQSVNFSKIFNIKSAIFSFKKDALYFLNVDDVEDTMWFDTYKDIVDCKIYNDELYIWLSNGALVNLKYLKIDKFLLKCYVDEKYALCTEICALFSDYLLSSNLSSKLHILVGLREKLPADAIKNIEKVLDKIDSLKDATQMKSGIFVVDNTYHAQTCLSDDESKSNEENKFGNLTPEALQAFKDLGVTVTDKLNSSKKKLKEKWEGFEDKMKHFSIEKQNIQEVQLPERRPRQEDPSEYIPIEVDKDIIYKESSPKAIEIDNKIENLDDKVCKSLYQYFRLSLVSKEEQSNLISIVENYSCDISEIHRLMLLLEDYCISVGASEESKYAPHNIFLTYLNLSSKKAEYIDAILKDETLYKYFVDSCITVNLKTRKVSEMGCECGFPLPYSKTDEKPMFSALIDEFVEKQWASQTRDQCYDICKKMPYLWRKILYLRRNEDLLNVLRILLQMLDENLLHSYLPQFTLDTWDRTIQLYVTLYANLCLNCNKKFDNINVKDTLNWDDLGAMMIKSVGGRNAIKLMERHSLLIAAGEISMKFYHTCLMVSLYEKYDSTVVTQLTEVLYNTYEYEDVRNEICQILRTTVNGDIKHTALPIIIAAKSPHWGLKPSNITDTLSIIIDNIPTLNNGATDCALCGLPLQNEFLIKDGGLWVFRCGHIFHGACLDVNKVKLCPDCLPTAK